MTGRARMGLAVLAGSLAFGSGVALMGCAGWLISRAAQQPPVLALTVAIVAVRALGISRGLFRYLERLAGHDVALRSLTALRVRVFARLVPLAPGALPGFRRGDLLSRFVADVDAEQDRLVRVLLPRLAAGSVAVASVLVLGVMLPVAGLLLLLALAFGGVVGPWLTARAGASAQARLAAARGALAADLVETLDGAADLVAYGAVEPRLAALADRDAGLTRLARRTAWAGGLGAAVTVLATGAAALGALVVGIPAVRAGTLDQVWLAVLVLVPLALTEVVAGLPGARAAEQQVRASRRRVDAVLDARPPVTEPAVPLPVPDAPVTLKLRNVRARWPSRPDVTDLRYALDGVDLDLWPGRRVGVVGHSGAGKSTLAAVLVRFCDIASGTAELSGVPMQALDSDAVRRLVVLCAQDAHLFDTTIRENLRLARGDAPTAVLRDALCRVRLLGWVDSLPAGLDTPVGEHGVALSGGERQRLSLARALLADPAVFVLDEPTAHLDMPAADALTRDLLAATAGRSTLLVTHRLAELHRVDEVLVLDAGRVVQRGMHDELVSRPGRYRQLWERETAASAQPCRLTSRSSVISSTA